MPHNQPTKTPNGKPEPEIKLGKMGLFPTMDSLQSVVELAYSQLPGVPTNKVMALLMTYHNTLLKQLEEKTNYVERNQA